MQEIERPVGVLGGLGLLAAMTAPLHIIPESPNALMHSAGNWLSAMDMYPRFAIFLAICGTAAICLAFLRQTRWLVLIGLAVGGITARLAWGAQNAHDLMAQVYNRPVGDGGADFPVADIYVLAWGWIAIGVAAAIMALAGAMAWIED